LYDGRPEDVGISIHFVDRGVDTGDLIELVHPPIYPTDNAEELHCLAEWLAFNRLADLLEGPRDGMPLPRTPQPSGGRTIRTRDRTPGTTSSGDSAAPWDWYGWHLDSRRQEPGDRNSILRTERLNRFIAHDLEG
jgi:hypothetical protein